MDLLIKLGLIFIAIGGIGGILLAIGQYRSSIRDKADIIGTLTTNNEKLNIKNDSLSSSIKSLNDTLSKRDETIKEKNDSIIELYKKLNNKSEYIANSVTGGNGYPILKFGTYSTPNTNPTSGAFTLETASEFPIFDLEVKLFDYEILFKSRKFDPLSNKYHISEKDLLKAEVGYRKSETLNPDVPSCFGNVLPLKESKYLVHFFSRNNSFVQRIIIKDYHSVLHLAYQVYNWQGTKLLEQGFNSNDYPIEEQKQLIEELESIQLKLEMVKSL